MTSNKQPFQPNDLVRNVNPHSLHHGITGTFQRLHDKWTFARGLACDVAVEGENGPYGYEGVIMSMSDLELIEREEGEAS